MTAIDDNHVGNLISETFDLIGDVSATEPGAIDLHVVTLADFVGVDEPGAESLLGIDGENALITQGGDILLYGDGGTGKTTLVVDLVFHLAAGNDWLGIAVPRPLRILLIENEGPRPQFRAKLKRKQQAWAGASIANRITVLEEPWSKITLRYDTHRQALAEQLVALDIDIVVLGPITAAGMLETGTIQHVRAFMALVNDVRLRAARPVAFFLIHHEGKSGQVSGAWEGVGDTLLHLQGQGHGRCRLFIQKARWSSTHHATALQLLWAAGDSFELGDPERDDDTIADEILEAVLANGGTPWTAIEKSIPGKAERLREIRDRLLAGGLLINAGSDTRTKLWHAEDLSRPDRDDSGTTQAIAPGAGTSDRSRPPSRLNRDGDGDDSLLPPSVIDPEELERLTHKHADIANGATP